MKITKKLIKNLILEELSAMEPAIYPITDVSLLDDVAEYFVYIIFNGSPMFSKRNGQQVKQFFDERGKYVSKWYAYPNTAEGWRSAQNHKNRDFPPIDYEDEEEN